MSTELSQIVREKILSGELKPGERVTEIGLSEMLNVSRTPIRNMLPALASEGYLEPAGKRGYKVKSFNLDECASALAIRTRLEGLAARRLAERGASDAVLAELDACLAEGDDFIRHFEDTQDFGPFGDMNYRFHDIILREGGDDILRNFDDRLGAIPFNNRTTTIVHNTDLREATALLIRSHAQHHDIVEAIRNRDGDRAEQFFIEHGKIRENNMVAHAFKEPQEERELALVQSL